MLKKSELVAYAMDFASYSISKMENISRIILYGSIAQGNFDEKSDVDIFIDTNDKNAQKKAQKVLEDYYKTERYRTWRLKGIENPYSIIAGELDSKEWKDLKRAIINTGLLLYGKYKSNIKKTNQYVLFSFENIKPDRKRVAIYRKLFGFKKGKKEYSGIAKKISALKIGKGNLLVQAENANEIKQYFQEKRVSVKLYDLWSDIKFAA
jgi:predicted nucleotidyltransferase